VFYVITRRTIRNVLLLIILLVVLVSVLLSIDWGRSEPNSGVVAWSQSVMTSIRELFSREAATREPEPLPKDTDDSGDGEAVETVSPNIVTTTVTIGDAWQWREGEPISSAPVASQLTAPSDYRNESAADALAVTGRSLRTAASPVLDVQPVQGNRFAAFRLERDIARSRQLEYLHGIINNSEVDHIDKQSAHEDLLQILKQAETETNIENLLLASGFSEAVVIIAENGVSVVVNSVISENEAARIGSLVAKTAQVRPEDVRILDGDGV